MLCDNTPASTISEMAQRFINTATARMGTSVAIEGGAIRERGHRLRRLQYGARSLRQCHLRFVPAFAALAVALAPTAVAALAEASVGPAALEAATC